MLDDGRVLVTGGEGPSYAVATAIEAPGKGAELTTTIQFYDPAAGEFTLGPSVPFFPQGSIDYYERVLERMGDTGEVADFARLFMAPGVLHCGGGPGLAEFDAFGALGDWVERGRAPNTITASRVDGGGATRPLCPYPTVATYDGTGDPDRAANFDCT